MVVLWLDLSLSSVSKHNIWSYYGWVCRCCRLSVNTIYCRIMIGLSLLSSISKPNIWSYYGWICRCRLIKHNRWSYYDGDCRCCHPSVNTIYNRCCRLSVNTIQGRNKFAFVVVVVRGSIMIGLSVLLSVSKHNRWSY